ncbi:hypothetical protein CR513_51317, partial [Mucuna pruriens]
MGNESKKSKNDEPKTSGEQDLGSPNPTRGAAYDPGDNDFMGFEPEVALHLMIMTLKPKLFSNSLCKRPLASMNELRARAAGYIQMVEIIQYQDGVKVEHQAATNHSWEGRTLNQPIERRNRGERDVWRPKYQVFTSLTTNKAKVLEETFTFVGDIIDI